MLSSLALYRDYAPAGVPIHAFALFLGIAMSITALPVLARILEERGLAKTPLGTTALTSAAIGDLMAWSLLAFVVAIDHIWRRSDDSGDDGRAVRRVRRVDGFRRSSCARPAPGFGQPDRRSQQGTGRCRPGGAALGGPGD